MSEAERRAALVEAARRSVVLGLNHGTTGNLSVRLGDGFLVTPSGYACDALDPADLVRMTMAGAVVGSGTPSSEWRLHRDIYRVRADLTAVVHAHPPFCTTLACLRRDLPPVHYLLARAGGTVKCSAYATFGTAELSRAAVEVLGDRRACLLANHGLVAVGDSPGDALDLGLEVERVAEYFWRGLAAGEPVVLDESEMQLVRDRFRTYGPGRSRDDPKVT
jgi:L-fuculose-phosphate aldolase